MYRKYRIEESIASSVLQYKSYHDKSVLLHPYLTSLISNLNLLTQYLLIIITEV